jgi:hypothetical protein
VIIHSVPLEAEHGGLKPRRSAKLWDVSTSVLTVSILKVKVTLRLTVSRPVCLGVRDPSGTHDQFVYLLEIFFRQLRVCYFVAPSLTRGRVCNLLLLLVLASAVPRDSIPYFIVPILETNPTSLCTVCSFLIGPEPSVFSSAVENHKN